MILFTEHFICAPVYNNYNLITLLFILDYVYSQQLNIHLDSVLRLLQPSLCRLNSSPSRDSEDPEAPAAEPGSCYKISQPIHCPITNHESKLIQTNMNLTQFQIIAQSTA